MGPHLNALTSSIKTWVVFPLFWTCILDWLLTTSITGSIVRIGPNEVSVNDVEVHNSVLFCQAPKFLKVKKQKNISYKLYCPIIRRIASRLGLNRMF